MAETPLERTDPRVVRSRRAVLDAALGELADRGYGAFAIDGVAARAGVARSTIYRLWPDRTALIADAIDEAVSRRGEQPIGVEGYEEGRWILMDLGDVIVHVFQQEVRETYDLERLWSDAERLDLRLEPEPDDVRTEVR